MSYVFKRLSEVEALTEVPEGAKVLAEANGQIVRVPGSGLGGSGGIKTAIIKASNYDAMLDFMSGKTDVIPDMENVTFSCTNMTFHEVRSAILAGESVNIVCMFVWDSNSTVIHNVPFQFRYDRIAIELRETFNGSMVLYKVIFWDESGFTAFTPK